MMLIFSSLFALSFLFLTACSPSAHAALPDPAVDAKKSASVEQSIVLAGGCFWGVEAVFHHVKGVTSSTAGYAGGTADTANYETVSTGATGHAESVKVTYNPAQITLGQLLKIYFSVVQDPTEFNRQGPDSGTQYRSVVFYADDEQKNITEKYIAQLDQAKSFSKAIVTQVSPLKGFYPAEAHHQNFAALNPNYPYIVINDAPKVENLKTEFAALYKD